MNLKSKKIIGLLALGLCFCLLLGTGYTVAKYTGIFDAGSFFLTLETGEIDPGEKYTVYYHTFDENRIDVVYKTETVFENIPFAVGDAPEEYSNLSFLGWSPQGVWVSNEDSLHNGSLDYESNPTYSKKYIRILKNVGENVLVADLLPNTETKEVHLYDVYTDFYIRTICEGTPVLHEYELHIYDPSFAATYSTSPLFHRWYRGSYYFSGANVFFDLEGKSITFYVHPGMQYRINSSEYVNNDYPAQDYYTDIYLNGAIHNDDLFIYFSDTMEYVMKIRAESNTDPNCFASGNLITMADGSQRPIEELKQGDLVRVYDHENGGYTESPILFIEYDGDKEWPVINLEFSDGTKQKFIYEHGLFDLDLNEYVYITEENCQDFIGHNFAKEEATGYSEVILENAWVQLEYTGCYSMVTAYHLNYFVNGMFSMPGGIPGLFNFFAYDEALAYDKERMASDIETYGLFTYEDFADYMGEETFNSIFPVKYLKVSIGKGLTTFEDLERIIERYIYRHGLDN